MLPYIEKDTDAEYFNTTSSTVITNPDCGGSDYTKPLTDEEINASRWMKIFSKWDDMTFEEKMSLFNPMVKCIDTMEKKHGEETDNAINSVISKAAFETCRKVTNLNVVMDRYGSFNVMIALDPIDPNNIPVADIREKVLAWTKAFNII